MKEQTAAFILETGKPATKTAKEMGIDVNTVCRWVRDFRKERNMPSYAEKQGIHKRQVPDAELRARNRFTRGNTIQWKRYGEICLSILSCSITENVCIPTWVI